MPESEASRGREQKPDEMPPTPPSFLYHYTSQAGLIGILKGNTLHCSNAHFLNDAEELGYAVNLARPLLEDKLEDLQPQSEDKTGQIELLKECIGWVEALSQSAFYVFSLSERGNLLSQWRAYCPDQGGYSIGFDSDSLQILAYDQGFSLTKCSYDRERQVETVNRLIAQSIDEYKKSMRRGEERQTDVLKNGQFKFADMMAAMGARFKHPSFSEEKEWRLISPPWGVDSAEIQFREGTSTPVPYTRFSLTVEEKWEGLAEYEGWDIPNPISTVWVGPTPHPELAVQSVATLLGRYGLSDVEVRYSETPYRTW